MVGVVVGLANHTALISRDGTERPIADSGAPILDGVAGWFSGRILERLPIGDHVGHLLEAGAGQVLQPGSDLLTLNRLGDLEAAHGA